MECPVCKTIVATDDQMQCPECHTDMEIFATLGRIEKNTSRQRNLILLFGFLLLASVAGGALFYHLVLEPKITRHTADQSLIVQQQETIQRLEAEKQNLRTTILEQEQQTDSLAGELQKLNLRGIEPAAQTALPPGKELAQNITTTNDLVHIVKVGESLRSLAIRYYGNKGEYTRIMKDNGIKDANHIWVGQRLKIRNAKNK